MDLLLPSYMPLYIAQMLPVLFLSYGFILKYYYTFMAAGYDKLSVSLAAIPPITFIYYVYIWFPCM